MAAVDDDEPEGRRKYERRNIFMSRDVDGVVRWVRRLEKHISFEFSS